MTLAAIPFDAPSGTNLAPVQVQYPAQGYATFMLGSRIPHRVTPVESNPSGERITLIQSLSPLAADAPDATIPTSFRVQDPRPINDSETARHYAWRAQAKLEGIVKTGMTLERDELCGIINETVLELKHAAALISDTVEDPLPYQPSAR